MHPRLVQQYEIALAVEKKRNEEWNFCLRVRAEMNRLTSELVLLSNDDQRQRLDTLVRVQRFAIPEHVAACLCAAPYYFKWREPEVAVHLLSRLAFHPNSTLASQAIHLLEVNNCADALIALGAELAESEDFVSRYFVREYVADALVSLRTENAIALYHALLQSGYCLRSIPNAAKAYQISNRLEDLVRISKDARQFDLAVHAAKLLAAQKSPYAESTLIELATCQLAHPDTCFQAIRELEELECAEALLKVINNDVRHDFLSALLVPCGYRLNAKRAVMALGRLNCRTQLLKIARNWRMPLWLRNAAVAELGSPPVSPKTWLELTYIGPVITGIRVTMTWSVISLFAFGITMVLIPAMLIIGVLLSLVRMTLPRQKSVPCVEVSNNIGHSNGHDQ